MVCFVATWLICEKLREKLAYTLDKYHFVLRLASERQPLKKLSCFRRWFCKHELEIEKETWNFSTAFMDPY